MLVGCAGIVILTYCDSQGSKAHFYGALWNIVSAVLYAIYTKSLNVIYKDNFDYGMFLGMLGLINVIILIPLLIMAHVWNIETFVMPSFLDLARDMGYAFLCTGMFEFFWANAATKLGAVVATVGFTAVMLPACLVIDFVLWPDPERQLSERYLGGLSLVSMSFVIVGVA